MPGMMMPMKAMEWSESDSDDQASAPAGWDLICRIQSSQPFCGSTSAAAKRCPNPRPQPDSRMTHGQYHELKSISAHLIVHLHHSCHQVEFYMSSFSGVALILSKSHMESEAKGEVFADQASWIAGSSACGTAHQNIWRAAAEQLPPVAVRIRASGLLGRVVARLLLLELPLCPPRLPATCCSPVRDDGPDSCLKVNNHFMRLVNFLCNTSRSGRADQFF